MEKIVWLEKLMNFITKQHRSSKSHFHTLTLRCETYSIKSLGGRLEIAKMLRCSVRKWRSPRSTGPSRSLTSSRVCQSPVLGSLDNELGIPLNSLLW